MLSLKFVVLDGLPFYRQTLRHRLSFYNVPPLRGGDIINEAILYDYTTDEMYVCRL